MVVVGERLRALNLRLREIAPALFAMTDTYPNENNIALLNDADWAWEFLRRNPDYKRDYRLSRARLLKVIAHPSKTNFIRIRRECPFATKWGLLHMFSPDLASSTAHIAWHADDINWAGNANARTANSSDDNIDFDVSATGFNRLFLVIGPVLQNLYMRVGTRSSCLKVSGDSVLFHPVHMRFYIDGLDQVRSAMAALEVVQATKKHTKLPGKQIPYVTQLRRLKYLIAAENAIEGSFLRDIGAAIYGSKRTETEWQNLDSRAFKDEIIRAKRKGLHFLNGGYREFLN